MSVGGSNGTTTSYDMAYAKPVINDAVNLFTKSFAQLQSGASAFSKGDELFTYTNKLNVTITNFAMSTTNDGGSQAVRSAALDAQRLNISALQGAVTGNGQSSIKSLNQSTGLLLNSLGVDTKPIAVSILLNKAQEATTSADKASSLLKALDILKGASTSSTLTTAPTQSPADPGVYVPPVASNTITPYTPPAPPAPVLVAKTYSGNDLLALASGTGGELYLRDGFALAIKGRGDSDKDEIGGSAGETATLTLKAGTRSAEVDIGKFFSNRKENESLVATVRYSDGTTSTVSAAGTSSGTQTLKIADVGKDIASIEFKPGGGGSEFDIRGLRTTELTTSPPVANTSSGNLAAFSAAIADLIKFVTITTNMISETDKNRLLDNLGGALKLLNQMAADPSKNTTANNEELRNLVTSAVAPILNVPGAEKVLAKVIETLGAITQQPAAPVGTSPNVNLSTALGINVALNSLRPVIANDSALSAEDKAQANALMASINGKVQAIAAPGGQTAAAISSLAADLSALVSLIQTKGGLVGVGTAPTAYNKPLDELAGAIRAANLTVPSLGASGVSS